MAFSDIFSILGLNSPAGPSYGAGDAATAATNPLAAVAAPSMSGYNDADVAQARSQTLMSLAPLLLGAGMRQMPSQRAATLAAGAAVLGQMPHNILNAAQTRLLNQKEAQAASAYTSQQAAVKAALADPNVSPAIKQLIQADPDAGIKFLAQQNAPTEMERLANAIHRPVEEVFDRQYPSKEQYGVIPDPMGEGFFQYSKSNPQDTRFIPTPGSARSATTSQEPTPVAPPLANPAGAFNGINADAIRGGFAAIMGTNPSPAVLEHMGTKTAITGTNNRIAGAIAGELGGLGRSKYQTQQILGMLPSPGSWTTSPAEAQARYHAILPIIDQRIQEADYNAQQGSLTKTERAKALQSSKLLKDTRLQVQNLVDGLGANVQGKAYTPAVDAARGNQTTSTDPHADILDIARRHIQ